MNAHIFPTIIHIPFIFQDTPKWNMNGRVMGYSQATWYHNFMRVWNGEYTPSYGNLEMENDGQASNVGLHYQTHLEI